MYSVLCVSPQREFINQYIAEIAIIYLHVSLCNVCVAYALNVRSTMEIRSHLCDFFLVFPFL